LWRIVPSTLLKRRRHPLTARQAIFIGMPPDTAVRLDGGASTASAISVALRKLGAQSVDVGAVQFLAMGAEHSVNIDGPLAQFGVLNQLDRVVVTGQTVAAGPAQAPVLAVLGGGGRRSLGAAPEYKAIERSRRSSGRSARALSFREPNSRSDPTSPR
jgi:hypothetical protein